MWSRAFACASTMWARRGAPPGSTQSFGFRVSLGRPRVLGLGFPWVYPVFSLGLPRAFPGSTQGFPWVYPGFSLSLPRVFPGPTQGFPWACPGFSLGLPRIFPGSTLGFPWAYPGFSLGLPRVFPGSTLGFPWVDPGFPGPGFPGFRNPLPRRFFNFWVSSFEIHCRDGFFCWM